MIAKLSLITLAIAVLAKASFTAPEGIANGLYVHDPATGTHTSMDGVVIARDLPSSSSPPTSPASPLNSAKFPKRWTGITCGTTVIASLDYSSAVQQLEGNCDGKTKLSNKNYYAIYNSAMVFMCNYKNGNVCTVGTAKDGTSSHMLDGLDDLYTDCSATLIAQKSQDHMTGYNRVSNSIVWGLVDSKSSAC